MVTFEEFTSNAPDDWKALQRFIASSGGQKAAAVKLGVSPQFVGQMFHGKRAIPVSIQKKLKPRRNGK